MYANGDDINPPRRVNLPGDDINPPRRVNLPRRILTDVDDVMEEINKHVALVSGAARLYALLRSYTVNPKVPTRGISKGEFRVFRGEL